MGHDFWVKFVLAVLATWRVTHLLANEDGPGKILVRFRTQLGVSVLGEMMDCFGCVSLWIAIPAALFVTSYPLELLFTWLAVSGGAFILERLGHDPIVIQPLSQPTDGESSNAMLRTTTNDSQDRVLDKHASPR